MLGLGHAEDPIRGQRNSVILSGNHLCHNPRVIKEADAMAREGYNVEVLGAWSDPDLAERDRQILATKQWHFTAVIDATTTDSSRQRAWKRARPRRGVATRAHRFLGGETASQLGYATPNWSPPPS